MSTDRLALLESWLQRHEQDTDGELGRVRDRIVDLSQRVQLATSAAEQLGELRETVTDLRVEMAALRTRVATVGAVLAIALPTFTTLLIKLLKL